MTTQRSYPREMQRRKIYDKRRVKMEEYLLQAEREKKEKDEENGKYSRSLMRCDYSWSREDLRAMSDSNRAE